VRDLREKTQIRKGRMKKVKPPELDLEECHETPGAMSRARKPSLACERAFFRRGESMENELITKQFFNKKSKQNTF
jgi:hypothetical protein